MRVNPARPYICRLIIFVFVFTPSVRPLWNGRVTAAMAPRSRSRPRVKAWMFGRSQARAICPILEPGLVRGIWPEQGGEGADEPGEAGHLGADGGQLGEQ